MSKVRVYEVARDLNVDQDQLVALLQSFGFSDVRNRMSKVDADAVERARRHIENQQKTPEVVEERLSATVVKRRRVGAPQRPSSPSASVPKASAAAVESPTKAVTTRRRKAGEPALEKKEAKPGKTTGKTVSKALKRESVAAEVVPVQPEQPVPMELPSEGPVAVESVVAEPVMDVAEAVIAEQATDQAGQSVDSVAQEALEVTATEALQTDISQEVPEIAASSEDLVQAPVGSEPSESLQLPEELVSESIQEYVPVVEQAESPLWSAMTEEVIPAGAKEVDEPVEIVAPSVQEEVEKDPEKDQEKAGVAASRADELVVQEARLKQEESMEVFVSNLETSVAAKPALGISDEPPSIGDGDEHMVVLDEEHQHKAGASVDMRSVPTRVAPPVPQPPVRPQAQRTGIDVWEGRPGVPMRQPPQPRPAPGGPVRRREYDPRANAGAKTDPRQAAGRRQWGGKGGRRAAAAAPIKKPAAPCTKEMSDHKKNIKIEAQVSLQALANRMSLKATEVLMKLISMGLPGVNINSTLDADTAKLVASEFGWEVEDVAVSEEDALNMARDESEEDSVNLEPRPPIVTVMGHVDHGKTSLLDQIRKTNVASSEAGGITQHVGAYRVSTSRGFITFLDTPGHAAFTQMRSRGAQVTDIVILVVAADDGVMPQTKEAISHARAAQVPIIVAVNKIDKESANPERIRREMADMGSVPEEWGGDTIFCDVSAKSREGLDALLEMTALQAELLELKANPKKPAIGNVIEALLDRGKGPVARVVVTDGTLRTGDVILAGTAWGKVRAMTDDRGRMVRSAGPSQPVEILGLNEVPSAGDPIHAVKGVKIAQDLANQRKTKASTSLIPTGAKVSLEELTKRIAEADQLELRIIIKADVQGSVEAVADALAGLSTEKVRVAIIHAGVGGITEGDVNLAVASKAIIIGFNVRSAGKAGQLAESEGIEIRIYSVIYDAIGDVKNAMLGLIGPSYEERALGKAEVRQTFQIAKIGTIAGCMVQEGTMRRNAKLRLVRDDIQIYEGRFASLKRFKDDAREVDKGFECGLSIDGYNDIRVGDIIECFEVAEVQATL